MTLQPVLREFLEDFTLGLYETYKDDYAERGRKYTAAIKIQAWFRGVHVRNYLKYLNNSAVLIQKIWRGHLGRRQYRQELAVAVEEMRTGTYNRCASQIQSAWRGYHSRKYGFNFYARKAYLGTVKDNGDFVREQLKAYEEEMARKRFLNAKAKEMERMREWAKSHHFCLSTAAQPGVYKNAQNKHMERNDQLLLSVRSELKRGSSRRRRISKEQPTTSSVTSAQNSDSTLAKPKMQGPFRKPEEVIEWRNAPIFLTLRVETDYFASDEARQLSKLEEWSTRLHDEPFQSGRIPSPSYGKMLHTTSSYRALDYGTKHFRAHEETDSSQAGSMEQSTKNRFQNIVPPITLFERLNREHIHNYVQL